MNILQKDLEFQIISWFKQDEEEISENDSNSSESDSDSSEEDWKKKKKNSKDLSKFKIYIFGKDLDEKTYSLKVNGFTPYFYVRIPDYCNKSHVKVMERWVRQNMWFKYRDCLLRASILKKHSFRNFDGQKKYNFIRFVFSNTRAMKTAVNLFQNRVFNSNTRRYKVTPKKLFIPGIATKEIEYPLYQNMVDALLKFVHHKNLDTVGWIKVKKGKFTKEPNNNTTCDYSLSCKWNDIKKLEGKPNTKIVSMAFDIECDSSHGDFPLPIKDYTKLAREIYNRYYKLATGIRDKKYNENNLKKAQREIENKKKFCEKCIKSAFKDGDNKRDISKVYPKYNNINSKIIDILSDKIKGYLFLPESQNNIEVKKHNTKNINSIVNKLNQMLPPLEGDKTIQIGMSFIKYGESSPYKNYMLALDTCDKIDETDTITFKNEKDLLLKFRDIIIQENADIITGWNTDGFDTPWLFKRAQELEIEDEFCNMSKFKDYKSLLKEKQKKGPTGELVKIEYVDIPGRIQMDLLPLIQKSHNLDSYKLDNVASTFIQGPINTLNYNQELDITSIQTKNVKGLNNGNFVVFSVQSGYLDNKYLDGKKFEIFDLDFTNNTFKVKSKIDLDTNMKCNWCLGKDDVSPQDIFRLQKGSSRDRYIIAKYCMMDVILCIEIMNKLQILTNNIGMANVCKNPLEWIIHRGQGVKILSLTAYFLKDKDYLLPFLYKDTFDQEGYEGAVVLDPQPGIYIDRPVAVLDYGSLYPSSMIEVNLSHETIIGKDDEEYMGEEGGRLLNKLGYNFEDVTYDRFKTIYTPAGAVKGKVKIGEKTVRYVQYRDGKKGIIPQILRYLLTARKTTRNKIKYKTVTTSDNMTYIGIYDKDKGIVKTPENTWNIKDKEVISVTDSYTDFEKSVFDGLQLAFKITANSLYGQIGAKTSDIYYKEIAASTTAVGRERLIIAKKFAEDTKNYPQVMDNGKTIYLKNETVYGDTDSVFVCFQCIDGKGNKLVGREARARSIELAVYTEKQIQKKKLREPQILEYEKTFDPFILLSKKRYVGNLYEMNPDKYKRKSMGIVLKRRDNAPIVKVIYGGIIDIIMSQKKINPSITYLRKSLRNLANGKFGLDTLIITKTLSSYYKDPDRIAHKVLADRIGERDPGNKPSVNSRIPFIYIDMGNKKVTLQGDRIENPDYIREHNLKPDYEFYITNQIMKPVSQIFALCLKDLPGFTKDIKEFDNKYDQYLKKGKSVNDSIKYMIECKRKEAARILFGDILRLLENKRNRNNEITKYFLKK